MPLYEYKCVYCDSVVEKIRKFTEDSIVIHCDKCEKLTEFHRTVSAPAFKVKGGVSEKMKVR